MLCMKYGDSLVAIVYFDPQLRGYIVFNLRKLFR